MISENRVKSPCILVVEYDEETRDGIEWLLKVDGYQVEPTRTPEEAILKSRLQTPHLLLMCPTGPTAQVIQAANQIRQEASLGEEVPIVIFCIAEVPEGAEVAIGHNVYLTRLDNFNQLRALLRRLLDLLPTEV